MYNMHDKQQSDFRSVNKTVITAGVKVISSFLLASIYMYVYISRSYHYRPSGLWGSGRLGSRISRHSAHEGVKVVTLTHLPSLPPGISCYLFLEAESTPGHQGTQLSLSFNKLTNA
jgi:hypothetical protein